MTAATCRCNDTGRVLADRQKRPVEVACGVCTAREVREMRARARHRGRRGDRRRAGAQAGVAHNHRNPFGAWPGRLVTVAWDEGAIDGVVPNSGSGAACGFALGGECTTIAL